MLIIFKDMMKSQQNIQLRGITLASWNVFIKGFSCVAASLSGRALSCKGFVAPGRNSCELLLILLRCCQLKMKHAFNICIPLLFRTQGWSAWMKEMSSSTPHRSPWGQRWLLALLITLRFFKNDLLQLHLIVVKSIIQRNNTTPHARHNIY